MRTFFFIAFRKKGSERGKHQYEREKPSCICRKQGLNHTLGMCPDWVLSPWPFGLWDDAVTNWATSAKAPLCYLNSILILSNALLYCFSCFGRNFWIYVCALHFFILTSYLTCFLSKLHVCSIEFDHLQSKDRAQTLFSTRYATIDLMKTK